MPDDFFNRSIGRVRVWQGRLTGKWYVQRCEPDSAGIPHWVLYGERYDSHREAMEFADLLVNFYRAKQQETGDQT